MKMSYSNKHTGLCAKCGRPTALLIHKGCGKERSGGKKLKKYSTSAIKFFARMV
jgi:hypothetical protein